MQLMVLKTLLRFSTGPHLWWQFRNEVDDLEDLGLSMNTHLGRQLSNEVDSLKNSLRILYRLSPLAAVS